MKATPTARGSEGKKRVIIEIDDSEAEPESGSGVEVKVTVPSRQNTWACCRLPEDEMQRIGTFIARSMEPLLIRGIPDIPDHQRGAALIYFTGDDIASCSPPSYRPELKLLLVQSKREVVSR